VSLVDQGFASATQHVLEESLVQMPSLHIYHSGDQNHLVAGTQVKALENSEVAIQ
jgi:hypothetical protein